MARTADTSAVRALLEGGAQVIEVLPPSAWRREHLPGAVNVPLPQLRADAVSSLDPRAPTVVYCYDHECDLSARGARVLELLGFTDVYDYVASKTAWLGEGLPGEGEVAAYDRAGARATRPPTCRPDATVGDIFDRLREPETVVVVVVDEQGLVLGALHPRAAGLPPATPVLEAADPGPATVRPSITRQELARSMDDEGQHHVIVSTSHGRLLGLVRRADLD
jgi:rhodanese-related sulfurtransferase/CBS domain-containing protein